MGQFARIVSLATYPVIMVYSLYAIWHTNSPLMWVGDFRVMGEDAPMYMVITGAFITLLFMLMLAIAEVVVWAAHQSRATAYMMKAMVSGERNVRRASQPEQTAYVPQPRPVPVEREVQVWADEMPDPMPTTGATFKGEEYIPESLVGNERSAAGKKYGQRVEYETREAEQRRKVRQFREDVARMARRNNSDLDP
ncbi:MAG: hypothetical protein AAFV33_24305 [Chloroflexota bacterium]